MSVLGLPRNSLRGQKATKIEPLDTNALNSWKPLTPARTTKSSSRAHMLSGDISFSNSQTLTSRNHSSSEDFKFGPPDSSRRTTRRRNQSEWNRKSFGKIGNPKPLNLSMTTYEESSAKTEMKRRILETKSTEVDSGLFQQQELLDHIVILEKQRKDDGERIDFLQQKVKMLQEELHKATDCLKDSLDDSGTKTQSVNDQGNSYVHQLYQNFYIPDLKQKLANQSRDVDTWRLKERSLQMKIENLKKENEKLTRALHRYRTIVMKDKGGYSQGGSPVGSARRKNQTHRIAIMDDHHHQHMPDVGDFTATLKARLHPQMSPDALSSFCEKLPRCDGIHEVFSLILRDLPKVFHSSMCTIFVLRDDIRDIVRKEQEKFPRKFELRLGSTENQPLDTYFEPGFEIQEPVFESRVELLRFKVRRQVVVEIVEVGDSIKPAIVIQLSRKHKSNFELFDNRWLRLICQQISSTIQTLMYKTRVWNLEKDTKDFMDISSEILQQRSYPSLYGRIRKLIPQYFGFEDATLLFRDSKDSDLFTLNSDRVDPTKDLSKCISKFPVTMGLTALALKEGSINYTNNVRDDNRIDPLVDNILGGKLRSVVIGGLTLPETSQGIGVLQLINKKGKDPIGKADLEKFAHLAPIIAVSIDTTNQVQDFLNIVTALSQKLQALVDGVAILTDYEEERKTQKSFIDVRLALASVMREVEKISL